MMIILFLQVKAELPDGKAASGIDLQVCCGESCKFITTEANGIVTIFLMDPGTKDSEHYYGKHDILVCALCVLREREKQQQQQQQL